MLLVLEAVRARVPSRASPAPCGRCWPPDVSSVSRRRSGLTSCLVFEESGGAAGDGQPRDGFAVAGELPAGLLLEVGAVVAVGEEPFEPVEFRLFLRAALEGLFL